MLLILLQVMEDCPESDREGFSQANLYFGVCFSGLNLNADLSLPLNAVGHSPCCLIKKKIKLFHNIIEE
jgi:hypothetical protein